MGKLNAILFGGGGLLENAYISTWLTAVVIYVACPCYTAVADSWLPYLESKGLGEGEASSWGSAIFFAVGALASVFRTKRASSFILHAAATGMVAGMVATRGHRITQQPLRLLTSQLGFCPHTTKCNLAGGHDDSAREHVLWPERILHVRSL
jgi:hypothetical protein